jgi:hypothetical protein
MDLHLQVYHGFTFRMEWISINWAIVQLIFTGKLKAFVILFSTFFYLFEFTFYAWVEQTTVAVYLFATIICWFLQLAWVRTQTYGSNSFIGSLIFVRFVGDTEKEYLVMLSQQILLTLNTFYYLWILIKNDTINDWFRKSIFAITNQKKLQ